MADTQQPAPQPTAEPLPELPGSVREAQEALLGLMESAEEKPETEEAQPTEEEESKPEEEDESFEEEPEEGEEGGEDDELEEADEDETTEEPEETVLFTVKVNGEDTEVTEEELIRGYSRQSDYTRKTQELAEERRNIEAAEAQYQSELVAMQQERQQYVEAVSQTIQNSMAGLQQYSDIDWPALKEQDPIEYITKRDEYREIQENVRANQHRLQIEQQKHSAEQKQERDYMLHEEHGKLLEKMPEWGEPAEQKRLAKELRDYALDQGFSQEEISSLVDHRSLFVLSKALRYDALQKADVKSKKVKKVPRVVRSGKGVGAKGNTKSKRAAQMKRLQNSGHIKDASALFEDFVEI
jgi:hypothetical protein